jgi:xylulokinase
MDKALLGIDVGTSGVKASLFDTEGRLLGIGRSSPYDFDSPKPTWAQVDPEKWWEGVRAALRVVCKTVGIAASDIDSVGISVIFPAVVAMDGEGDALYPAIMYNDQRSLAQVREIDEVIPREEYEGKIGNVLVPGTCAVTSILWLKDEESNIFRSARVLGFANTYISHKLTGELYTDPSISALSGLVDIKTPRIWSEEICDKLSIPAEKLPGIKGAAELVGTVSRKASEDTGLSVGTPVACGCGDSVAAATGAGAVKEGTIVYVAGSTDCVTLPLSRPTSDRRWINCGYVPQGVWFGIGSSTSTGVSIEWFQREMVLHGLNEAKKGQGSRLEITELAESCFPGATGLIYLPYLQGERSPIWDPQARGMFVGLTASTTRCELARAVLEGTAFALRHIIESLDGVLNAPITEIRAVGGGTKNTLWNQIKADVLQKPLDVLDFQESSSLGAALLGGIASGIYHSFERAGDVARRNCSVNRVDPDPLMKDRYDEIFALYKKLYSQTREVVHSLAQLNEKG